MQEPSLKGLLSISDTATSGSVSSSGSSSATWGIAKPASAGIQVRWARHLDEVRRAQKLRFEVFGLEMGPGCPLPSRGMTLICLMTFASTCWCLTKQARR